MGITNIILLLVGLLIIFIGIAAFFIPNWARWINFPGGPRLKAVAALIIGMIILIFSIATPLPTN